MCFPAVVWRYLSFEFNRDPINYGYVQAAMSEQPLMKCEQTHVIFMPFRDAYMYLYAVLKTQLVSLRLELKSQYLWNIFT